MDLLLINSLLIENFKGIDNFSAVLNGNNAFIYGDNGAGKTTIYDAWLWLIFGKNSEGRADFEFRPIRNEKIVHREVTSVKADIIFKGETFSLKKRAYERWGHPKGRDDEVLLGIKTDYFVNDVAVKKADYDTKIREAIAEDIFKILANPLYFNESLSWQKRRSLLMRLTVDVSDTEIAQTDDELVGLVDLLKNKTAEELKKELEHKKKNIEKDTSAVPYRIAEVGKSFKEMGIDETVSEKEIAENITELESKRKNLMAGVKNPYADKLTEMTNRIAEETTRRNRQIETLLNGVRNPQDIEMDIENLKDRIAITEKSIEETRNKWLTVKEEKLEIKDTCPCCGQKLLPDKIQASISEYNKLKAGKLEEIAKHGKQLKKELESYQKRILSLNKELEKTKEAYKKAEELKKNHPDYDKQIQELKAKSEQVAKMTEQELSKIESELVQLRNRLAKIDSVKRLKARLEEIKQDEKVLKMDLAEINDRIEQVNKLIENKVEILENNINKHFELVNFRLFKEKARGNFEDTCDVTIDGVPYSNLNHGAKINAGLDVIRTMQNIFGIGVSIFIDGRESITKIIDMGDTQVINLVVKPNLPLTVKPEIKAGRQEPADVQLRQSKVKALF